MKVKELIAILNNQNPEANVVIGYCSEGTYDVQRVVAWLDQSTVMLDGSER